MTERKEAVRADAQRLRTDAAMLNSLADTFRIIANGGPFICSFNANDVAEMLDRAADHISPCPRPAPTGEGQ